MRRRRCPQDSAPKCDSPSFSRVRPRRSGPRSRSAVGGQGQRQVRCPSRSTDDLGVAALGILPLAALAAVVEHRLAVQRELDLAVDAPHGAQQHVLGVVVGGRRRCACCRSVVVVPGPHDQHVAHDQPPVGVSRWSPGPSCPAGSAGRPAPPRRPGRPGTTPAARSRIAPNTLGRVQASGGTSTRPCRSARPGGDLAVGQERVVGDRREGRELVDAAGRPLARSIRRHL